MSSGGIGNSASENFNAANDGRVVGGDGSSNSSTLITGGTNTLTDHGAVQSGISAALAGIESATAIAQQAQATQGGIFDGALRVVGDQQKQFTNALENVKTADVRVLIIAAIAGVAMLGLWAMRGKG